MPTARPRYAITETEEISAALHAAAQHWPGDAGDPSKLLFHLIAEGAAAIAETDKIGRRRAVIEASSGAFAHVYGPGYLEDVRKGWPE